MAKEFLYVAQVCAAVQEVRGEGMAQGMRADVMYASALRDVFINHAANRARGDARALIIKKDRL